MKQTDIKDLSIRVSGLLQAIIASGEPEVNWEQRLQYALKIHQRTVKALASHQQKTKRDD